MIGLPGIARGTSVALRCTGRSDTDRVPLLYCLGLDIDSAVALGDCRPWVSSSHANVAYEYFEREDLQLGQAYHGRLYSQYLWLLAFITRVRVNVILTRQTYPL